MNKLPKRNLWLCLSLIILAASHVDAATEPVQIAEKYVPRLERILTENIAPFWYEKSLDRKHGGYIINFDPVGEPTEPVTKMIVTQARQLWLFARMARAGYRRQAYLDAAELGYRFLTEKMWDQANGGFYWEVDVTGDKKLKPRKHLYGQSFGLYAISEYYLASRKKKALDFAVAFFELLERKSHDKEYGGYVEFFEPDWTTPPADESSYMGTPPDMKLMNTHLHLLEAMTTFYRASKLPPARERLLELINIQTNAVVRKDLGACTDKYDRDWTPRLDGDYAQVSYGHDIENIWLVMDASNAVGMRHHPFMDLYETLFTYSLKHGYDARHGGFYYTGAFNQPADNRNKSWWVQAEVIVSALHMYRATNDLKYLDVFTRTFDLIENEFVDWEHGEWHHIITPGRTTQGNKASPWKGGYHNGRAMIECIEILRKWKN